MSRAGELTMIMGARLLHNHICYITIIARYIAFDLDLWYTCMQRGICMYVCVCVYVCVCICMCVRMCLYLKYKNILLNMMIKY